MPNEKTTIHNAETGETVEREMTNDEVMAIKTEPTGSIQEEIAG